MANSIIFDTNEIRAIQDGRKSIFMLKSKFIPPYKLNQKIYVRETWCYCVHNNCQDGAEGRYAVIYRASENGRDWENESEGWRWKSGATMPKEIARFWIEITEVKSVKIQEIKNDDIVDCGNYGTFFKDYQNKYGELSYRNNETVLLFKFKIVD